jgi:hypothetical protein
MPEYFENSYFISIWRDKVSGWLGGLFESIGPDFLSGKQLSVDSYRRSKSEIFIGGHSKSDSRTRGEVTPARKSASAQRPMFRHQCLLYFKGIVADIFNSTCVHNGRLLTI